MALTEMQRKYLLRMAAGSVFADDDRAIGSAKRTLHSLEKHGYVRHMSTYHEEPYMAGTEPQPDGVWEITDEGLAAIGHS